MGKYALQIKAFAVVPYLNINMVPLLFQEAGDVRGVGMLADIGQRLLENSIYI
jgi:hypothetical protein